ncbi:hypothetical protein BT96DRAFT_949476 [Gymnopus androsaceus JB14]|uniref:Uncharacterized protein n=1 Tax=Gymnopus androsaceus JB14 TaxID=1447944 RepID=A0A6A4GJU0_9AGAR|nr:hypothetical protein BT96DRAFT_949476 [Gymnopus androsaceus JB14]
MIVKQPELSKQQQNHGTEGQEATIRSIPHPSNLSHIKIADICKYLDLSDPAKKLKWNSTCTTIRNAMLTAMMDPKSPRSARMIASGSSKGSKSRLYDAAEEAVPDLKKFKNQWAVKFIAHHSFGNARLYN